MDEETKYYLAFNQDQRIGARTFLKLRQFFGSMQAAWQAKEKDLLQIGLPLEIITAIKRVQREIDPDKELKKVLAQKDIKVITLQNQSYPRLLKEIADPPALLYIRGDISPEDELAIAVVGARACTSYGRRVAEEITADLARAGLTIVSGLALGIDSVAHRACLAQSKARTIAVLPSGIDYIYPPSNRGLAQQIIQGRGAIVSEYPLGMPSLKNNFPVRNRIIAGLSLGTVVIEASIKSGTFLTAKSALEYNREVLAVPGDIFSPNSSGCHNLIKMGAKLVTSIEDILSELNIETKHQEQATRRAIPASKEEAVILSLLSPSDPVHIDKIVFDSELDVTKVNATIIMMEMKGMVRNLGGNQYVIK